MESFRLRQQPMRVPGADQMCPHLRLGITLSGMRELYGKLPAEAVELVNAAIPLATRRAGPNFHTPQQNSAGYKSQNGYDPTYAHVNQHFITNQAKADNLGVCERLQAAGSPHVGQANVFVSCWFLGTRITHSHTDTHSHETDQSVAPPRPTSHVLRAGTRIRRFQFQFCAGPGAWLGPRTSPSTEYCKFY